MFDRTCIKSGQNIKLQPAAILCNVLTGGWVTRKSGAYHVRLPIDQTFTGKVKSDQATGAGRVHIDTCPGEIEEPTDPISVHACLDT